jgi:hypothetical protein
MNDLENDRANPLLVLLAFCARDLLVFVGIGIIYDEGRHTGNTRVGSWLCSGYFA